MSSAAAVAKEKTTVALGFSHPRFDEKKFKVDYKGEADPRALMLTPQARAILGVLKAAVAKSRGTIKGLRLREVLEANRAEIVAAVPRTVTLGDSRQTEIFRAFQDYRSLYRRAGLVVEVED